MSSWYFVESQIKQAFDYMFRSKKSCDEQDEDMDPYVCMYKYFDGPKYSIQEVPGITLRAFYNNETKTFHFYVTPYYECFKYELLKKDYVRLVSTAFLVDKVEALFKENGIEENYCITIDNTKGVIHSVSLHEGFFEESDCFIYKRL